MRAHTLISMLIALLLATCASAQEQTLYLLRHFEKQLDESNPSLTVTGQQRAKQLAIALAAAGVQEIYSSDYNRTKETVTPLAERLGLTIKLYDPAKLDALAAILASSTATIVIAGHSNTTPALVRLLGGQADEMDESQYGTLFNLHKAGDKTVTILSEIGLEGEQ
jgi:broad specificity phosphatase PhoE